MGLKRRIIMSLFLKTAISSSGWRVTSAFAPQRVLRHGSCHSNDSTLQNFSRRWSSTSPHHNQQQQQENAPSSEAKSQVVLRNTGGLRRLPVVKNPKELMATAQKATKRVKNDVYVR
jgi:hypothetical protein